MLPKTDFFYFGYFTNFNEYQEAFDGTDETIPSAHEWIWDKWMKSKGEERFDAAKYPVTITQ